MNRAKLFGIVALVSPRHGQRRVRHGESSATHTPRSSAAPAPKVTVAQPLVASVGEWTDAHRPRRGGGERRDPLARHGPPPARCLQGRRPREAGRSPLRGRSAPLRRRARRARRQSSSERASTRSSRKRDAARAEHALQEQRHLRARLGHAEHARSSSSPRGPRWPAPRSSSAQLDLDYAYIRAPIAGRIGRILVTQGNLVGPAAALAARPRSCRSTRSHVYVESTRRMRCASAGRSAGACRAVATGRLRRRGGHPHAATLDFVDNRVDPQTGTLRVRVVVKNAGRPSHAGPVRPRAPARGRPHDTVLVADRAVGTDQDRRYVYVVDARGQGAVPPGQARARSTRACAWCAKASAPPIAWWCAACSVCAPARREGGGHRRCRRTRRQSVSAATDGGAR